MNNQLEIYKKLENPIIEMPKKPLQKSDVIVTRPKTIVKYIDGKRVEEVLYTKTNLTKKINETAKVLKLELADQTMTALNQLFEEK
jgi:hypothetical protein